MVTLNVLRTCEGKQFFVENKFETAVDFKKSHTTRMHLFLSYHLIYVYNNVAMIINLLNVT